MTDLLLALDLSGTVLTSRLSSYTDQSVLVESVQPIDLNEAIRLMQAPRPLAPDVQEAFGLSLTRLLLPASIVKCLTDALLAGFVRLRCMMSGKLIGLPVEAIYLPDIGHLGRYGHARVCRHSLTPAANPTPVERVSVLIATADPKSREYGALLEVEKEARSIHLALSQPDCRRISPNLYFHATPAGLGRELATHQPHVFHYAGHGDVPASSGVLVLEGAEEHEHAFLHADRLANMLLDAGTSLAVLGACYSGEAVTSVGIGLAEAGIPAVVAMQQEVGDHCSHLFARAFYAALAEGESLEEAVWQGRMALGKADGDWMAPILITGSPGACPFPRFHERGNLPERMTSYIGRRREIDFVSKKLELERIVTLLGSGGIGKTSLSIEVGKQVGPDFAQGCWFVALDSIPSDDQVVDSIAAVFGIRDSETAMIEQRLFEFLREQNLLLILDNCEHVVAGSQAVVNRVLKECPGVHLLVTTRTLLEAVTDFVIRVEPLSYPTLPDEGPIKASVRETLGTFESTMLFLDRAKSSDSRFQVNEAGLEIVSRIVRRLDGIPLAIELAACRVRMLTLSQIYEMLNEEFHQLDLGKPGKVPRHQTMRATLEWSYGLLTESEQGVLDRLGVFVGSFSLEAAQEIVADSKEERNSCFQILSSLADKSLVVPFELNGRMRYRILETTRHFALGRLTKRNELPILKDRHLKWMERFVEEAFQLLKDGDQTGWNERIVPDHESAIMAIDWALSDGKDPQTAALIARNLHYFWFNGGHLSRATKIYAEILDQLVDVDSPLRVILLAYHGAARVYLGEVSGMEDLHEAHGLAKGQDDFVEYQVVSWLADCAYQVRQDELAITSFQWLIDRAQRLGRKRSEGQSRLNLGDIYLGRGQFPEARRQLEQYLDAKQSEKDDIGVATGCMHLGYLERLEGGANYGRLYLYGIELLSKIGSPYYLGQYLVLAMDLLIPHNPQDAAAIIGYADRIMEESSTPPDRFLGEWISGVRSRILKAIPEGFEKAHRTGRTLTMHHVLGILRANVSWRR